MAVKKAHQIKEGDVIVRTVYRQDGFSRPHVGRFGAFLTILTVTDVKPIRTEYDDLGIYSTDEHGNTYTHWCRTDTWIEMAQTGGAA